MTVHDLSNPAQVILGLHLKDGDGAFGYYRSRPLLLSLGASLADALGSGMGLAIAAQAPIPRPTYGIFRM